MQAVEEKLERGFCALKGSGCHLERNLARKNHQHYPRRRKGRFNPSGKRQLFVQCTHARMATKMHYSQLSTRGSSNIASIAPSIGVKIIERRDPDAFDIDLSTDENCLLREELTDICKSAANDGLRSHVRLCYTLLNIENIG